MNEFVFVFVPHLSLLSLANVEQLFGELWQLLQYK